MDDGHKQGSSYYLNTYAFTKEEQEKLLVTLMKKFNLSCSLHRYDKQYKVYIKAVSAQDFKRLVYPYIVSCFLYKLHN